MTRTRTHTHGRDAHGRERERERERALLGTTVYNRHTHAHTWELERLCPVTVPWSVDGVVAAEQERILRVSRRMHSRSGFALRPQPMPGSDVFPPAPSRVCFSLIQADKPCGNYPHPVPRATTKCSLCTAPRTKRAADARQHTHTHTGRAGGQRPEAPALHALP
jgi:hypothetical protein